MIRPLMAPRYYYCFSILEKDREKTTAMSEAFENNTQNEFLLDNMLKHQEVPRKIDRKMSDTHKEFIGESQKTYDLIKGLQTMKFNQKVDQNHSIKWSSGPSLQYSININSLSSLNFRIQIWKEMSNPLTKEEKLELRGEIYVFIQKFLGQVKFQKVDGKIVKEGKFEKEIYLNGTKEGTSQVDLQIAHQFFFQQKLAGVQTEKGFIMQSPIIFNRKEKDHSRIKEFRSYQEGLTNVFNELSEEKEDPKIYSERIINCIRDANNLLQKSQKTAQKSFVYKNEAEIDEFQIMLLNYLELLLGHYEEVTMEQEQVYFRCLRNLLRRGELSLQNLKFDLNQPKTAKKLQIGLHFQKLIYQLLYKVLVNIN